MSSMITSSLKINSALLSIKIHRSAKLLIRNSLINKTSTSSVSKQQLQTPFPQIKLILIRFALQELSIFRKTHLHLEVMKIILEGIPELVLAVILELIPELVLAVISEEMVLVMVGEVTEEEMTAEVDIDPKK